MPPSSSSPPSCSSHSSGRSSGSRKHVLPPGQDEKEQGPSRETITIDKEKAGRVCEGGNEMSIKTKSSSGLSSSSTQSALDTLRLIAGSGVRRSKCRAEFLEKLAKSPEGLNVLDKDVAERLRIIIGKEAVAFFRKFIGDEPLESGLRNGEEKERLEQIMDSPVVFGICVLAAGRRVVDYYMTWRGETKANIDSPDPRRNSWDHDFRRVRKSIDHGYRQMSTEADDKDTRNPKSDRLEKQPLASSRRRRSSIHPNIIASSLDTDINLPSPDNLTANRPSSANDSVISLPFLGAIRNVPLSNRLPLRVTNPDQNSVVESSSAVEDLATQISTNTFLETLIEAPESAENESPDHERQVSIDTLGQANDANQQLVVPKDKSHKGYAESVSGRSSRSDQSKRHRSRKNSSNRRHHELSQRKSDKKGHGLSSSRHEEEDGQSGHGNHHHRSSKDDDDRSKHKHRPGSGSKRPLENNVTLVMVDPDKVGNVSVKQVMKQPPPASGNKAWHGLTFTKRPTKSGPTAIKTPWTGPLACASDGVRNIAPHSLDSDSDDYWEHIPGMPKRESVILQQIISADDSGSESDLSSSSPPLRSSPPVERHYIPAKPETQAIYSRASSLISSIPAQNNHTSDLNSLPCPRGIPVSLQVLPHTYGSPSVNYNGLTLPTHASYGVVSPASGYTSGYTLSPLIKSPANLSHSSLPSGVGYNPGFGVPTPVGSNATPLPGIHHALANAPGSTSPFLYSTPRASPLGSIKGSPSPYVPAWISPQSTASSVLPGTLAGTMFHER